MKREKRLFVKEWLPAKKGDHKRPSLDAADLSEIHTITNGIPFRKSPLHCFALCRGLSLHPLRENRVCSPLTNTAFVTILHHLANKYIPKRIHILFLPFPKLRECLCSSQNYKDITASSLPLSLRLLNFLRSFSVDVH